MPLAYIMMNKMVSHLLCPNIRALATCFYRIGGGDGAYHSELD
jgi:hypothetical protein